MATMTRDWPYEYETPALVAATEHNFTIPGLNLNKLKYALVRGISHDGALAAGGAAFLDDVRVRIRPRLQKAPGGAIWQTFPCTKHDGPRANYIPFDPPLMIRPNEDVDVDIESNAGSGGNAVTVRVDRVAVFES